MKREDCAVCDELDAELMAVRGRRNITEREIDPRRQMKICTHTESTCISDIHTAEWGDKHRGACKVRDNDRHDCAYVDARNALIPAAENATHAKLRRDGIPNTPGAFARYFSEAMEHLVRERGIVAQ